MDLVSFFSVSVYCLERVPSLRVFCPVTHTLFCAVCFMNGGVFGGGSHDIACVFYFFQIFNFSPNFSLSLHYLVSKEYYTTLG